MGVAFSRWFAAFWFAGFLYFEIAAMLAYRHAGAAGAFPFGACAVVLFVLSLWTFWRHPWALAASTVLGAGMVLVFAVCIVELLRGAGASVVFALVYGLAGSALFGSMLARHARLRKGAHASAAGERAAGR
jgi:hypothetical protein